MNRIHQYVVAIAVLLAIGSLGKEATAQADNQRSDVGWASFNGGYDGTRFSALTQINKSNVASVQEVARFRIPETMSFQCDPVVIGDTMYLTTLLNTYAIDARTGAE